MFRFKTVLLAGLIAVGMPLASLSDFGTAMAKGAKATKGTVAPKFKAAAIAPPVIPKAGTGGRLPPRPPAAAAASSPPKPPKKLTPVFNAAASKPKPPKKPDTPVPVLKPKGPTFTPGS